MNPDIARTALFVRLLHAFQSVERTAYAADGSRRENDAEHSYFLAMLCWYLSDSLKLRYSVEKLLKYALAHDLVETYAGDTYIFDDESQKTKKAREEASRQRIAEEFPEFNDLHMTIVSYEQQREPEAAFVYVVDKLIPAIINYLQGGKMWKEMKVVYSEVVAHKREKVSDHEPTRTLLEQLIVLMEKDLKTYFTA